MNADLLIHYEAIEEASLDMLQAARAGAWDRVAQIEGACRSPLARLDRAQEQHWPDEASKRRAQFMQRLVIRDAEICWLVESWRDMALLGWPDRPVVLH